MRSVIFAAVVVCQLGLVWAGGMPQTPAKVNMKPPVCPPCAPCVDKVCDPCPPAPPCMPVVQKVIEFRDIPVYYDAKPQQGQWLLGPTLQYMSGGDVNIEWVNVRNHQHNDPAAQIRPGGRWGLGAIGGYRFPGGITLLGNVTRYEDSGSDVDWYSYEIPRSHPEGTKAISNPAMTVGVSVLFPIGGRK